MMLIKLLGILNVAVPPNPKTCNCSIIHNNNASAKDINDQIYRYIKLGYSLITLCEYKYACMHLYVYRYLPRGGNNPKSHRRGIRLSMMYEHEIKCNKVNVDP